MPELPDITIYVESLKKRVVGQSLTRIRISNPFLLRTYSPSPQMMEGKQVTGVSRLGKRVVIELAEDCFAVIHLMLAGRLHWKPPGAPLPRRYAQGALDFASGTLLISEAGKKRRASLHLLQGRDALDAFRPAGIEVFESDYAAFSSALTRENHTVKRALTDQSIVSGIGNTFSDEILHAARISPLRRTGSLTEEEMRRLHDSATSVLADWVKRLRDEIGDGFPEKVTAFRDGLAVHGKYGEPCPVCSTPVQRIRYAENESNYCPTCQTEGKLLADRALSRLLKSDWPRSLDELEKLRIQMKGATEESQKPGR